MANVNKVTLIGNLTRDLDLRRMPSGSDVGEFGLATNRTWTDKEGNKGEETTFVDLVIYGKGAAILQQYIGKGDPLYVEGRLKLETWDDKDTGQKRSKTRVVVENFQFLGGKRDRPAAESNRFPDPDPTPKPTCRNKLIKTGQPTGGSTCGICQTGPCQVLAYAKQPVAEPEPF